MIAVAESVTGGAIMAKLVEMPGASSWFAGGVVAYDDFDKVRLGVNASDIAQYTSQSAIVTESLARVIRDRYSASVGLAITGNADEGHAWIAVSTEGGMEVDAVICEGSRVENLAAFRDAAIKLLKSTGQLP
jgi:PncC family amidohydrolase